MKRAFIFSFLLITIAVKAQTLSSSLVSSGGTILSSSNLSLIISIGQPMTGDVATATTSISQGFLGIPSGQVITAILEKEITLSVFPNPTTEQLFIQSEQDLRQLQFDLIDMSGRKVHVKQASSEHSIELQLHDLAPALYVLRLQKASGEIKTISIIKSNY